MQQPMLVNQAPPPRMTQQQIEAKHAEQAALIAQAAEHKKEADALEVTKGERGHKFSLDPTTFGQVVCE
jgi:hypothetical protein